MPHNTNKWVSVVTAIISHASPEKRQRLNTTGILSSPCTARKRKDCEQIVQGILDECNGLKQKRSKEALERRNTLAKILVTSGMQIDLAEVNESPNSVQIKVSYSHCKIYFV